MSSSSAAFSSPPNRLAVVTGSNKGIGFFIALQLGLSNLFSTIIVACRDETRGKVAVEQLTNESAGKTNARFQFSQLTIGDKQSHASFRQRMQEEFGKIDCLVNNGAFAFKNADPTPFKEQCKPTLDVNFRGTVDFTEELLPLIRKGDDPRIVSVASMAGRLGQIASPELRDKFSSDKLTMPELQELVNKFEQDVMNGTHRQEGWGNSNYGMSKLAIIAATKIWARENPSISVNCCCPGYCSTDMTSHRGTRSPSDGARNAVIPSTMENPPTGEFFSDYQVSEW